MGIGIGRDGRELVVSWMEVVSRVGFDKFRLSSWADKCRGLIRVEIRRISCEKCDETVHRIDDSRVVVDASDMQGRCPTYH